MTTPYLTLNEKEAIVWKDDNNKEHLLLMKQDDMPQNPRTDFDQYDHMICWHRRYTLGDKHNYETPYDMLSDIATQVGITYKHDPSYEQLKKKLQKHVVILPLWLYDHSGITMSCGERKWPYTDQWDSGQVGYIFMLKSEIFDHIGNVNRKTWRQKAIEFMTASVKEYDMYLTGDIYGYILYDKNNDQWEESDSCWGFYGSNIHENGIPDNIGYDFYEKLQSNQYDIVDITNIDL